MVEEVDPFPSLDCSRIYTRIFLEDWNYDSFGNVCDTTSPNAIADATLNRPLINTCKYLSRVPLAQYLPVLTYTIHDSTVTTTPSFYLRHCSEHHPCKIRLNLWLPCNSRKHHVWLDISLRRTCRQSNAWNAAHYYGRFVKVQLMCGFGTSRWLTWTRPGTFCALIPVDVRFTCSSFPCYEFYKIKSVDLEQESVWQRPTRSLTKTIV